MVALDSSPSYASNMKRKNLKLIAHRVPLASIEHLRRAARRRRQTIAQTLADAIGQLSD